MDKRRVEQANDEEYRFARQVLSNDPNNSNRFCLATASGKRLGEVDWVPSLQKALALWDKLPEEERRPGAIQVPDLKQRDPKFSWLDPPAGGLSLRVFTRNFKRNADGKLIKGDYIYPGKWDSKTYDVARNTLWLTAAEWRSLVPANPRKGSEVVVAAPIRERIVRFYLTEIYRTDGERHPWRKEDIRASELALRVKEVSEAHVQLELRGRALVATEPNVEKSAGGYKGALYGDLVFDRKKQAFRRFNVLALGEHWWKEPDPVFLRWAKEQPERFRKDMYFQLLGQPITVGVAFELAPPGFAQAVPGGRYEWPSDDPAWNHDYWGKK